ncbi:MAG: hypothetical protein F6K36_27720 [Symploca sp. SIO3C6]|uniref:Uncharacterized protein n=1 Tax=Symploca sp. SIO1C4 TaxID=2607765 RepID=A0A6B3NH61_9CYAN|nr:hypothetical protein [Symploca sp. SIO3C6]NER31010.1 hypothetical protein [Symploca sp. SIO1C4]NET05463.1 hypothetical protein [Symploca sp. SIO2B6]
MVLFSLIRLSAGLGILALLSFGLLQWFHISAGHFLDWLIGIASFWWLLVIVVVPWNVHFEAREVLAEASVSTEKEITIDPDKINYVKSLSKWSLVLAIALHLLSAVGLYTLAATGISAVGYLSSGAALLLTCLRPTIRLYEYLATRLAIIRQEFKYPRADIQELNHRVESLENTLKGIEEQLDPEEPYSWVATYGRYWQETRKDIARLEASLRQQQADNDNEHNRLSQEAKQAIAQLTTDSQFLDHVREIIRFFKTA